MHGGPQVSGRSAGEGIEGGGGHPSSVNRLNHQNTKGRGSPQTLAPPNQPNNSISAAVISTPHCYPERTGRSEARFPRSRRTPCPPALARADKEVLWIARLARLSEAEKHQLLDSPLLVTQSNHGINFGCAASRNVAGEKGSSNSVIATAHKAIESMELTPYSRPLNARPQRRRQSVRDRVRSQPVEGPLLGPDSGRAPGWRRRQSAIRSRVFAGKQRRP